MTQETALDILKLGYNVYLTGAAGSGKTYVLNQYIKYLKEAGVEVGVTASTGIAATHMGGVTIHSWTGMGIKDRMTERDISNLIDKPHLFKRMERVKVLIIDEVSMLHHFRLDIVDQILRSFKKTHLPFGGIQVVLCGDFFQLPPISRRGESPSKFIYHSDVWRVAGFKTCYLEEQHRQTDDESLRILNDIRNNQVSEDTIDRLRVTFKKGLGPDGRPPTQPTIDGEPLGEEFSSDFETVIDLAEEDGEEIKVEQIEGFFEELDDAVGVKKLSLDDGSEEINFEVKEAAKKFNVTPTRLFTHNMDVDSLNDEALESVSGEEFEYYMESSGVDALVDLLKKSCLAPEHLRLKIGAKVMFVKNNFEAGYVNGSLGVIVAAGNNGPVVKLTDGTLINVQLTNWSIEEDGKVKAEIIQYPLRLAWAITIHKSQGMSLDAVEVDLSRSFEKGMGYVALSRVRTLGGLTILGLNDMALRVHDEVIIVDEKLRAASERAVGEVEVIDKNGSKEKRRLQKEYLDKIAPSERERKAAQAKRNKLSTFDQTRVLVEEGKTLAAIAEDRGVNEETIIDHLEKIIESDPEFLEIARYLRDTVSFKKQLAIRKAFSKAYPDLAEEAGELGSHQYDGSVFRKSPLAPVKHAAGANASYKDIRLMRILG
ncbi:MAG: AAA family ATPase [Patescibacteria group bacterium]